jgi:hypothetical protein
LDKAGVAIDVLVGFAPGRQVLTKPARIHFDPGRLVIGRHFGGVSGLRASRRLMLA